jgi:hypothetical protein
MKPVLRAPRMQTIVPRMNKMRSGRRCRAKRRWVQIRGIGMRRSAKLTMVLLTLDWNNTTPRLWQRNWYVGW